MLLGILALAWVPGAAAVEAVVHVKEAPPMVVAGGVEVSEGGVRLWVEAVDANGAADIDGAVFVFRVPGSGASFELPGSEAGREGTHVRYDVAVAPGLARAWASVRLLPAHGDPVEAVLPPVPAEAMTYAASTGQQDLAAPASASGGFALAALAGALGAAGTALLRRWRPRK